MADDSDIPPLEDMTEVLKQASTLRAGLMDSVTDGKPQVPIKTAKDRAKVKKNVAAKVVNLENVNSDMSAGDHTTKSQNETTSEPTRETSLSTPSSVPARVVNTSSATPSSVPAKVVNTSKATPSSVPAKVVNTFLATPSSVPAKAVNTSSGGSFGGLKKGFLFGGSPKSSSHSNKNNVESVKPVAKKEGKSEIKTEKDDIPLIVPKIGKEQSGLTIDEVQQAMSEAKGLLDNQDWINDDLLNQVEKNELLLKRFADPQFMKALQEFQTNPTAAMEKYKGNQEVEKFLAEFCGLLGDHFTNLGNPSNNVTKPKPSGSTQSDTPSKISELPDKKTQPKIVEIVDNKLEPAVPSDLQGHNIENVNKKCPQIIELSDNDKSLKSPTELCAQKTKNPRKDIVESQSQETDIQRMPPTDDMVKEMLKDPRVMEILMDPTIMNLIQQMKSDPEIAQRTVDTADLNLKDKIKFLVSKGLMQFQNY